jgi:hypothetical protein
MNYMQYLLKKEDILVHSMQADWGSRGIASLILNLSTGGR